MQNLNIKNIINEAVFISASNDKAVIEVSNKYDNKYKNANGYYFIRYYYDDGYHYGTYCSGSKYDILNELKDFLTY